MTETVPSSLFLNQNLLTNQISIKHVWWFLFLDELPCFCMYSHWNGCINLNNNYQYLKVQKQIGKAKRLHVRWRATSEKQKKTVDFITFVDLCNVLFQCLRIEIQREINQKRYWAENEDVDTWSLILLTTFPSID